MNKPNNYDNTTVGGYERVALGGHKMVIKKVVESTSKAGNEMLIVYLDFAQDDVQPGKFTKDFSEDTRSDKKWPHAGTVYIPINDRDGNCTKKFKGFTTSFEQSNGCETVWGKKFADQFTNKRIGGVYGEVENEYNGKRTMRHELRWFRSVDKVDEETIPEPVYLNGSAPAAKADADGFMNIPEGAGAEVPWG